MPPTEPPDTYPITGLCMVAEPSQCPPGYNVMLQSHDKKDDCDLWKDSFFRARVTRYLCFTRVFPLNSGRLNNVLNDITINNVGELPPAGFSLLEKTVDTSEKANRKKQVCVKMVARNSCADGINDLIFLSKQKRPPSGYCIVGDVNGLLLCYKIGAIPVEDEAMITQENHTNQQRFSAAYQHPYGDRGGWEVRGPFPPPYSLPAMQGRPQQSHPPGYLPVAPPTLPARPSVPPMAAAPPIHSQLSRQDSVQKPSNPMYGVPFHLHPRFRDLKSAQSTLPSMDFRSRVDLDNEYQYSFHLEHQAQAQSPLPGNNFLIPI